MGLLNKDKKKKALRTTGRGASSTKMSAARPQQVEKLPPCTGHCPSGNDIRGWLTIVAQAEKSGLSVEQAYDQAFQIEAETMPLPSIMGRVCPHPCESHCNRGEKDGSVAINAVERFIGDWALERDLKLPTLDVGGPFEEKVAVIGAGPAGLSCAYQLARRGYPVTIFESLPAVGGMLRYGIPDYRLPRDIIDKEVQRIADLGVTIECGKTIGKDISLEDLRGEYKAVFAAIGAHRGKKLGVPGEDGPGVYTGTEFLRMSSLGEEPEVGSHVVVIGGGDTAIDAARVSLRYGGIDAARVSKRMEGVEVTILYRRTRTEMPAIEREIEEALEEGIHIEFLAAPAKILRNGDGAVEKMLVQRMELGEPDSSGRRRPVPIEGDLYELEVDTVITAVSQAPDVATLGLFEDDGWFNKDEWGKTSVDGIWTGGDNVNLGLATIAIGEGRKAAASIHATLRGEKPVWEDERPAIEPKRIMLDFYEGAEPAVRAVKSPEERLRDPSGEIEMGLSQEQTTAETARCFSCGSCFGCERCWMYCTPGCFKKVAETSPGTYYTIKLDACDGCDKCRAECPCGFIDMS